MAWNESIEQEGNALARLWEVCRASVADHQEQSDIQALFNRVPDGKSGPEDWSALNCAEMRVGRHLTPDQLKIEFAGLLGVAEARKLSSLARHQKNAELFTVAPPNIDLQRAAYQNLLYDLQSGFSDGRFDRRNRSDVAARLFRFGLGALGAVFILPLLVLALDRLLGVATKGLPTPGVDIALVAALGVLGAYFSRILNYQSALRTLGFGDVVALYLPHMLMLRLMYGMLGALIFHVLIRSGVIGGTIFPSKDAVLVVYGDPVTPFAPTGELAKMMVWSFLAGFSERLVPDALSKAESRASTSDRT